VIKRFCASQVCRCGLTTLVARSAPMMVPPVLCALIKVRIIGSTPWGRRPNDGSSRSFGDRGDLHRHSEQALTAYSMCVLSGEPA
jgi:hypothetical protein